MSSTAEEFFPHHLGEDDIINLCAESLHFHDRVLIGPGDDCAVLSHPDGRSVISTDVIAAEEHFSLRWSTPYQAGARAAVQNMADIAAMGAVQHSGVAALSIPKSLSPTQITEISRGLSETMEAAGGALVGGDLSSGKTLTISVTVIGDMQGREPLLRSGARPGDAVIFAGNLGLSPAGLRMCLTNTSVSDLSAHTHEIAERALASYKVPTCPFQAGPEASRAGAHSLMDVSDGLNRDAGKIARMSHVHIDLNRDVMEHFVTPLRELAAQLKENPWTWVLGGGEDHGLIGTCDKDNIPEGFTVIGEVYSPDEHPTSGKLEHPVSLSGQPISVQGWDHFA